MQDTVLGNFIDLAQSAQLLDTIVFPFNPVPASRPRVSKWGTYYGKKYTAWRKLAIDLLGEGDGIDAWTVPLLVVVENIVKRPKTTKRDYPVGDVDNYMKAPLDSITKAKDWWVDDDQILWGIVGKRFAKPEEQEKTIVEIYTCNLDR